MSLLYRLGVHLPTGTWRYRHSFQGLSDYHQLDREHNKTGKTKDVSMHSFEQLHNNIDINIFVLSSAGSMKHFYLYRIVAKVYQSFEK